MSDDERPIEPLERVIHDAIQEWHNTEGGPTGQPSDPTLAHYVAVKVRAFLREMEEWVR